MNRNRISGYPRNSPQAAARILALTMISDGRMQASELLALEHNDANGQLALTAFQWQDVVHDLCADLMLSTKRGDQCMIDARLIEDMLDAVDDAALQRRVLRLCAAVAHADGEIHDGESVVLLAAIDRWGLDPEEQPLLEPLLYGMDFQVTARPATVRQVEPARVPCALLTRVADGNKPRPDTADAATAR
jgi:tellurite resistance protein